MSAETIPALLPCPFCGGAAHMRRRSGTTGRACRSRYYREHVKCETCGVMGPEGKSPNASVNRWNRVADRSTRPAEPAPEVEPIPAALLAIVEDRADWLIDAAATASQNRILLRGDEECDNVLVEAVYEDAKKAITVAVSRVLTLAPEIGDDEQTARRRHEPKRKVEPLVRLSTLEAERARADAAEAREHNAHLAVAEERRIADAAKAEAKHWSACYDRLIDGRSIADADALFDVLRLLEQNVRKRFMTPDGEAMHVLFMPRYYAVIDTAIASLRAAWERAEAAEASLSRALQDRDEAVRVARNEATRVARDFGFDHALKILESALGSPTYYAADGSETWEGDTRGTIYNLLRAAGVWRGDDDNLVTAKVLDEAVMAAVDEAVRVAVEDERDWLYDDAQKMGSTIAADWLRYIGPAMLPADRARLRADQRAGEGGAA